MKKTYFNKKKIEKAAKKGNIYSLGHAGAAIRKQIIKGIKKSPTASTPGTPVHTRGGLIRRAVRYQVENEISVVVGPRFTVFRDVGKYHEYGGKRKKSTYPKRPFAKPGLEKVRPRLPSFWSGTIKE